MLKEKQILRCDSERMNSQTNPNNSQAYAIGVFDSGVGGLNVLRALQQRLPHEDLYYVADSAHAPYGNQTTEAVRARCLAICDFFLDLPVKAIVVACNTATAAAVETLRDSYNVPIIAMEPGLKPAVGKTRSGVVGVLATPGTLGSAPFARLAQQYTEDIRLIAQPCPGLVELIEQGKLDKPETTALLTRYVAPLLEQGADTIVLGCTHYPFIAPLIERIVGNTVTLIDTSGAVARQVQQRLAHAELLNSAIESGQIQFWTSGVVSDNHALLSRLWPGAAAPKALPATLKPRKTCT